MTIPGLTLPEGARILEASGWKGTGNVLLLFPNRVPPAVLKVYRVRRSPRRELLRGLSHRLFEGKRGASARARRETEVWSLQLWSREGFDVVKPLDLPIPPELEPHPVLWLEYIDAPTLRDVLQEKNTDGQTRRDWIRKLSSQVARRHQRALEIGEPLLIQEHAVMNHLFVMGQRLITFDLENGFRAGFSIIEAMAQEVAGYTRSLLDTVGSDGDVCLRAWVEGYGDRGLLRHVIEHAVGSLSFFRRLKRYQDRKRGAAGKTAALERLLPLL